MIISVIVAINDNHVIGADNKLLWHLPDDLKNFKKVTSGHTLLMGRKTFDSIGRPLPNRTNLILTRQADLKIEGCVTFNHLSTAIKYAADEGETELFVIGGAEIYQMIMPMAHKLYLTRVHADMTGDAHFPDINFDEWEIIQSRSCRKDVRHAYDFEMEEYVRLEQ